MTNAARAEEAELSALETSRSVAVPLHERRPGIATRHSAQTRMPPEDAVWLTQGEAAALIGLPVSTVEWWATSGKVETRPRSEGPTIHRASLLAHVERRRHQAEERAVRRRGVRRRRPALLSLQSAAPVGRLSVTGAAELLGLSLAYLPVVARQTGILMGVEHGRLWFDLASVEAEAQRRAHEAERWVSYVEAARIAGCSPAIIGAAVRSGDLAHRTAGRGDRGGRASIDRDSAVAFGQRRAQKLAEKAAAKQSLKSSNNGPPDDGEVWLSSSVSGLILGISAGRVHQLAAADRLPHVRVGNRLWFRRRDIEQISAARAFRLLQRHHNGCHNPEAG